MRTLLDALFSHPLGCRQRLGILARLFRWRVACLRGQQPVAVPFVNDCRLVGDDDEPMIRGTLYVGLHEFAEMAFLLHLLRPGDTFADIGAGVGAYTVLASRAVGAMTHALEPNPQRCARLHDNIALNGVERRIQVHAAETDGGGGSLEIDQVLGKHVPVALRIDLPQRLERSLEGATCTLASEWVRALLIRLPVPTAQKLHVYISTFGFTRVQYDPLTRILREQGPPTTPFRRKAPPTPAIYIRDTTWATRRLQSAPPFHTLGQSI